MLYHNDWCSLNYIKDRIRINVNVKEDDVLNVLSLTLDKIFNESVKNAISVVGNNPVICLSGGIDSQATLDIWNRSGLPFTAITFDFGNNFNSDELKDALSYARFLNIPVEVIKLDVMRFLFYNLQEFSQRYKMLSPQFCVHAYFIEHIKSLGYTGVIMGGNGFILEESSVEFHVTSAQLLDIEKYSTASNFPVIPSFLSFNQDLCLLLSIKTPIISSVETTDHTTRNYDTLTKSLNSHNIFVPESRYISKIQSYTKLGLQLKPQSTKKTGFEQLKKYYNSLNRSDLAFDREFRLPLLNRIPEVLVETHIDKDVKNVILKLAGQLNP